MGVYGAEATRDSNPTDPSPRYRRYETSAKAWSVSPPAHLAGSEIAFTACNRPDLITRVTDPSIGTAQPTR
jgi:hypothetical protein